jgi:dTMP kinase
VVPARGRRPDGKGTEITSNEQERPSTSVDPTVDLVSDGRSLSAYTGLLRNRNYRLWFFSGLGSSLGDWAGLFALQVLVLRLAEPGSRLALFGLGGIMMARLLPSVIFGPIAGVLADRYDRKRLMVTTDIARAVLFVGIAFSRDLVGLLTLTFLVECLSLLYIAAKDASLPKVVAREHLAEANQLNLMVTYGPLPFGALAITAMTGLSRALDGAGVATIDPITLALMVNAATFLLGGLIISGLRLPPHGRRGVAADEDTSIMEEIREGLVFIRDLPLIRALILGVVGVFFGAGVIVSLGPEFVRGSLGRPGTDWPTLMTFVGGGVLAGLAIAAWIGKRFSKERLFPIFLILAATVATFTATLPSFDQTLVAGTVLGAMAGISAVLGYTLLHENTVDETRARTFAAFYMGTRVAMFAALGLAPFLAGVIGRFTIGAGGRFFTMSGVRITLLAGGLVAMFSAVQAARGMYRALRHDSTPAVNLHTRPEGQERTGLFIAFEGVEGSGKSTQVKSLVRRLEDEGHEVVVTREPGGAPIAERIRQILLDPNAEGMHPRTEALLYAAARAEHVQRVILPALSAGKVVVCDRFIDSSLAYQGFARELGDADVSEINRWGIGGVVPDVVVLLHLDPEVGLARVAERARRQAREERRRDGEPPSLRPALGDRIEREDIEFHRRVADGYLQLAKRQKGRFIVVDASDDAGTISRQIRSGLHAWLPLSTEARRDLGQPEAAG